MAILSKPFDGREICQKLNILALFLEFTILMKTLCDCGQVMSSDCFVKRCQGRLPFFR